MDEDSNQSSRSSNQPAMDMYDEESKHRESDSQMTLTYGGSDSELNDTDTLRLEDSDDDQQGSAEPKKPSPEDGIMNENSVSNDRQSLSVSPFEFEPSDKQDEAPERLSVVEDNDDDVGSIIRNRKKISQLIDTDSEEERTELNAPANKESNINEGDEAEQPGEDLLKGQSNAKNVTAEKIEESMNRFKSLIDSDSASPANDSDRETAKPKKKKKLKTKKERDQGKSSASKGDPNDLLSSLNLDFSDDENRKSNVGGDESSGSAASHDSGSGSEIDDRSQKKNKSTKSSDDKPQRMSAKAAMEQMQVIQSESQRMAREAAVSVPYHRPKQHTLQEFLSRRTILKPVVRPDKAGNVTMGRKKAAAAIKMTPEQLAAYAKQLEEREKEAMEFFKSESDESEKEGEEAKQCDQAADVEMKPAEEQSPNDTAKVPASSEETNLEEQNDPKPTADDVAENVSNGKGPTDNIVAPMDTELGESLRVSDTEDDALDALVNKTSENVDALLASQSEHENLPTQAEPEAVAGPSNPHPVIDYDPFPEPPTSILAQKKAELLKDNSIKVFPTLKGDPNMVIDFDSGDVLPKTPSGPDLLLERFVKCSGKKAHKASSLDILSTDKGTVEINTVKLGLEQEERDPNGKEPVPGAAHMKLKQSLWEKMEQARRDSFLKRQQETYPAKKIDDDEEDEEEAVLADKGLAEEYDDEEEAECDEDDDEEVVEGKQCDLLDDEAEVDEDDREDDGAAENQSEESNEDEDEGSSDEESEQESKDAPAAADGGKKKSRIIAAFEDSDEENLEKETDAVNAKTVERTITDELFSTLEGNEKFTPSDRSHLETGENMTLLWKDTEEQESTNAQADEEDLLALCSGRFETTQARPPPSTSESLATTQAMTTTPSDFVLTESDRMTAESEPPITTEALFTQRGDQPVDDSELIALCSGTFATQRQTSDLETEQPLPSEVIAKGKLVIASSDEEDLQQDGDQTRKKKCKRRNLNISDDEEESELEPEEEVIDSADDDNVLEDEEEPERYVDYDSEENEVEVVMTKKDKEKRASAFVENEAELSESEWGSADEDEKDLDRYDMELGDEEKFDQDKLQEELERIHMRRMLEQDKKEVKTLQDMFFEDEEKDGVGRERQFRWRNVETTFSLDYDKKADEQQKAEGEDSDGETEAQWRKMRFERDMLLKEKKINLDPIDLSESLENERTEDENAEMENNSSIDNQSTLIMQRKITIVRHINTVEASNKPQNSCFLIKKATTLQNTCNASFLARDEETLQRLANLVKVNPETEGLNTATAGKGRNFVFTAVSPAVDKMGSKRSSDAANLNESPSSSAKKMKTVDESPKAESKSKKRLLLAQLM